MCVAAGGGRHVDRQSTEKDPMKVSQARKFSLIDWSQRQNVSSGLGTKIISASSHSARLFLVVSAALVHQPEHCRVKWVRLCACGQQVKYSLRKISVS